jgi:hypothetical protein
VGCDHGYHGGGERGSTAHVLASAHAFAFSRSSGAIANGRDVDIHKAAQIAGAARLASDCLDEDRPVLYLEIMKPAGYEFQSDFARHHFAWGQAQGRAALVVKLLTRRFGPLTQQVEARIAEASIAQLDEIGERLLTAQTLDEALGSG